MPMHTADTSVSAQCVGKSQLGSVHSANTCRRSHHPLRGCASRSLRWRRCPVRRKTRRPDGCGWRRRRQSAYGWRRRNDCAWRRCEQSFTLHLTAAVCAVLCVLCCVCVDALRWLFCGYRCRMLSIGLSLLGSRGRSLALHGAGAERLRLDASGVEALRAFIGIQRCHR
jgi:hypothetical protein